jgi:predicted metal-binding membrane protein
MLAGGEAARERGAAARVWDDRGALANGVALLAIAALAWIGVLREATAMSGMPMDDPAMSRSGAGDAAFFLVSWGVMMAAMMLPSASPMVALYAAIQRNAATTGQRGVSTAIFALVYIAVWLLFGVPVYLASVGFQMLAANNATVAAAQPYVVAGTLLVAGAYQLTPLKDVCLRACRGPLGFLMGRWRSGYRGSLELGLAHAAYCVGCCWALMVVLVAAGAMGLHWVLLIAAVVFAEKLLPRGRLTSYVVGTVLIALGVLVALRPEMAMALRMQSM